MYVCVMCVCGCGRCLGVWLCRPDCLSAIKQKPLIRMTWNLTH